jgi:hypothetical protein
MVRSVINSGAANLLRPNKAKPYRAQILELYSRCDGNLMRVYEELMAQSAPFSYQTLTRFVRRNPFGNAKSSVTRSITTAQQWLTKIVPGARSLRNPQHRVATKGILFLLASCHAALRLGPTARTRASSWGAQGNLTKFSVFWRHAIAELGGRRDVAILPCWSVLACEWAKSPCFSSTISTGVLARSLCAAKESVPSVCRCRAIAGLVRSTSADRGTSWFPFLNRPSPRTWRLRATERRGVKCRITKIQH